MRLTVPNHKLQSKPKINQVTTNSGVRYDILALLTQSLDPERYYVARFQVGWRCHSHTYTRRCTCGNNISRLQTHEL